MNPKCNDSSVSGKDVGSASISLDKLPRFLEKFPVMADLDLRTGVLGDGFGYVALERAVSNLHRQAKG